MRVYGELSKSRLSALVVATTGAGHLMASGPFDATCLAAALGGTYLLSASANSFNQVIETRNDAAMNRTAKRPLPSGRISRAHAIGWASTAGATGLTTLVLGTNCVTATLGAATLGLYTLVYTPMKQRSPLNTWVGAVVGAIPPVMGWTAAGGPLLCLEAATLGTSLFLWQMPHFFALAWMYRADYAQGGYRMIPLHDPAGERTSALCLEYSLYLAALPPACWAAGLTSCMFAIESVGFNGVLLLAAWRFYNHSSRGQAHARRLFLASLAYLPVFFTCLLVHQRRPAHVALEGDETILPLEESLVDGQLVNESIERIRTRGRELCLHEQLVTTAAQTDGSATDGAAGPIASSMPSGSGRCPVVVAETVVSHAQVGMAQQQQQQQPQQQR